MIGRRGTPQEVTQTLTASLSVAATIKRLPMSSRMAAVSLNLYTNNNVLEWHVSNKDYRYIRWPNVHRPLWSPLAKIWGVGPDPPPPTPVVDAPMLWGFCKTNIRGKLVEDQLNLALSRLYCADVPLSNYSLTHSRYWSTVSSPTSLDPANSSFHRH